MDCVTPRAQDRSAAEMAANVWYTIHTQGSKKNKWHWHQHAGHSEEGLHEFRVGVNLPNTQQAARLHFFAGRPAADKARTENGLLFRIRKANSREYVEGGSLGKPGGGVHARVLLPGPKLVHGSTGREPARRLAGHQLRFAPSRDCLLCLSSFRGICSA